MTTRAVVQVLALGLGTLAAAAAMQQPAPAPRPPSDATWRAVVVDGTTETLLLLEPAASAPVRVGAAVPGVIFEPRDPSRLVFLRPEGRSGATATIFSQAPARTVGPVSLGDCGVPPVGAPAVAFEHFRRRIVEDAPGHLILSCVGMLASLDLERGTATTHPAPSHTTLRLLGDERVLAVSSVWRGRPLTTELGIHDAHTLAVRARVQAEGQLILPALVPGGREIVLIGLSDELAPGPPPTTLRYFDASTLAETRTVSLGAFRSTRPSPDGGFVYATNMNRNTPKQTARELRILRIDTGEVLETIALLEHANWFIGDSGLPLMIEDRRYKTPALSRLLVLDEGRVRATLPVHDFVHQLSVDRERGRMYLLDGRSLAVYTWPGLQLEQKVAVGKPSDQPHMSLTFDGKRALVVSGSRAVAVDLVAGTAQPEAKLGSSGARAGQFWGKAAMLPLYVMSQSGPPWPGPTVLPGSPFDPAPVAFSADGRTAMLLAPTGQLTTIDMASGRALRHVPAGDGAVAFAGVPMVIAADAQASWLSSVATGEVVARFPVSAADADATLSASVSPDGRLLLIGRGTAVHLLEAATGRLVKEWTGLGRVGVVRFLRPVPTS